MVYLYNIGKKDLSNEEIKKGIIKKEVYCYNCSRGNLNNDIETQCKVCTDTKEIIDIYKCCECKGYTSWYDQGSSLNFDSTCNDKNILCSACNSKNLTGSKTWFLFI